MTEHRDDIPTIGPVGDPRRETSSARPRRVPIVSLGLALAAALAFILATRPSEPTTSNTLPPLPPTTQTTTTTTSSTTPQSVRLAFDRAPFEAILPAWAVSDGVSSWLFSAAQPASGERRGTGLAAYSTDGQKWIEHGVVIDEPVEFWYIEHTGGWFTASAITRAEPFGQVVYVSRDGVGWSRLQPPEGRASSATGGPTGLLVITYPHFDDTPYRRAIEALPDDIRPEVESGRLHWWFDEGPAGAEVVVGIFNLQLGRFPLPELNGADPSDDTSMVEPPTIWLVQNGGETWERQTPTATDFWPNHAITVDDGTVLFSGWTGMRTQLVAFDGREWTELEGIGYLLGLSAKWKGWFLTLRGAQVMASTDLANWEVILQIEPVRQSLTQLYAGANHLVATHTLDLVLSAIEPTSSLFFDDIEVVFDYASLTIVQDGETLVRHPLSGRQAGVASLEDGEVVVFDLDGTPIVRVPLDDLAASWRHINDQYAPAMAAILASDLRTWTEIELPFPLSPERGSVAVGEHHLVMIERSTDTETAPIWVGRLED